MKTNDNGDSRQADYSFRFVAARGAEYMKARFDIWRNREVRQTAAECDFLTLIPVDILEAIGAVTVNFAAFEESIGVAIGYLLADRSEGLQVYHQAVTAELSFKQRVWMFANVFKERYAPPADWLNETVRDCFRLEQDRNAIVHSVWQMCFPLRPDKALRLKTSARKQSVRTKQYEHTREQLASLAKSIALLGCQIESAALAAFAKAAKPFDDR